MKFVLIMLSGETLDRVKFRSDVGNVIRELIRSVEQVNPEKDDTGLHCPEGLVVNAKATFEARFIKEGKDADPGAIYVIVNPVHSLGYLVLSVDEPIGYQNPEEALFYLEKVRREHGARICLFRAEPVQDRLVKRKDLEDFNTIRRTTTFDYSLISEYLK